MKVETFFCDWCCIEGETLALRSLEHRPGYSDSTKWSLVLCAACRTALDGLQMSKFEARRELHAGVTGVERRAKEVTS